MLKLKGLSRSVWLAGQATGGFIRNLNNTDRQKMKIPKLTRVTAINGIEDPALRGRFCEIVISDSKREIRLGCDRNSDELILSSGRKKERKSRSPIFRGAGRVDWMWTMTNQQGYFDGFRIQILARGQERVFEFISIASTIDVFEARKPIKPPQTTTGSSAPARV
jgi:hypothetical protein